MGLNFLKATSVVWRHGHEVSKKIRDAQQVFKCSGVIGNATH